jgi:hypothetical protein
LILKGLKVGLTLCCLRSKVRGRVGRWTN